MFQILKSQRLLCVWGCSQLNKGLEVFSYGKEKRSSPPCSPIIIITLPF